MAGISLRMSVEPLEGDAAVAVSPNGGAPIQASRVATSGWNELSWTLAAWQWPA